MSHWRRKKKERKMTLLDILKQSECGLTKEELFRKAEANLIQNPQPQLSKYEAEQKVRFDPSSNKYKATTKAFA